MRALLVTLAIGLAIGKGVGPVRPSAVGRACTGGFRSEGSCPPTKGGDNHKDDAGAGAAVDLPRHPDVVVEGMLLAERSLTGGVGISL